MMKVCNAALLIIGAIGCLFSGRSFSETPKNIASSTYPDFAPVALASYSTQSPIEFLHRLFAMTQNGQGKVLAEKTQKITRGLANSVPNKSPVFGKSPVAIFRQLLAMTREEREKFLAARSDQDREEIMAKVNEYLALRPEDRELKLKATELRWYLRPLLYAPESERPALLAAVPPRDRKLVEDRLRYLDQLPAEARRALQTNEMMVIYFSTPVIYQIFMTSTNSDVMNAQIQKLQAMPEEQRQKTLNGFREFFEFSPAEKEKIMSTLSDADRQAIAKTLKEYEKLPKAQRDMCIQSFEKLARMPEEQRKQFLSNVAGWRMMTPQERQQWKDLVENLNAMPPTPPGFPGPPTITPGQ